MKRLRVEQPGGAYFHISVPDDAKMTFGPWSPPLAGAKYGGTHSSEDKRGTLRIYRGARTTGDVLGVFSGVTGFMDESAIQYENPPPAVNFVTRERVEFEDMSAEEKEELAELVARSLTGRMLADKDKEPGEF